MLTRRNFTSIRLTLVLLLVVSSIANGASRRLPLELRDPDLATFLQMGGQITQLCGSMSQNVADGDHCPACDIVPAVTIPAPIAAGRSLQLPQCKTATLISAAQITPPVQTLRQSPRAPPEFSA